MAKLISIFVLLIIGSISCFGNPVANISTPTNTTLIRQDGDDGVDEAIAGFEAVSGPIAQIISGTLSGNIGQLFGGITGTVTDQEAQPGVGNILSGVAIPLSTLWAGGIQAGQKYFNITTPNPLGAQVASSTPLPGQGVAVLSPQQQQAAVQQQGQQVGVAPVQQAPAQVAAPVVTTTPIPEDEDEDEFENDLFNKIVHKI